MSEGLASTGEAAAKPVRRIAVCVNIHCTVNGSEELVEHLVLKHGIVPDGVTPDGVACELTYCFAACDEGPNVEIDGEVHEGMTADRLDELLAARTKELG